MANYSATVRVLSRDGKLGAPKRICYGVIEAREIIAKGVDMGVALWYRRDLANRVIVSRVNWSVESVAEKLGKERSIPSDKARVSRATKKAKKWAGNYDPKLCASFTI